MKHDHCSKPFPALTSSQRLHLDIFGYVIIENVLSRKEVTTLLETTLQIERRFRATGKPPSSNSHISQTTESYFRIDNLPHLAPCYFDYVTHPRLLGMVEELVGGSVRLEQSDAHIRRSDPTHQEEPTGYGFHRGINPGFSFLKNGLYHFTFVKTLTNLTDLGPLDGGTTVIPGTHKIWDGVEQQAIIDAAMADPRLIHQVEAPAGSTLLFFESLIHASGIIRSDKDRVLIIGGYTPTMFQAWNRYDPNMEFADTLTEEHRSLLTGDRKFNWQRRERNLGEPAGAV